MSIALFRINFSRFKNKFYRLAEIGALEGGGVWRLSLDDEDKKARDFSKNGQNNWALNLKLIHWEICSPSERLKQMRHVSCQVLILILLQPAENLMTALVWWRHCR